MPDVADLKVHVGADVSDAERGLDSLGSKVGGIGSGLATAFGGAAIAGIAGLAAGLGASVVAAADFEKTMSAVKAVSGATGEEMSALQAKALQLGKDTSFSASEAGKGIEELVKGGLTIPDIMNGAAEATLNLAAAGGVSLPEAATIAANALAQFNLKGEDMAHVADLIAGAANASALDVSDFSFSLKAAGAVASTVGFSFDDLAQGIAVMGKAGITGSDAGTSLKTMMLRLQPSTDKTRALFQELGLETRNLEQGLADMRRRGIEPQENSWKGLYEAEYKLLGIGSDATKWTTGQRKAFDALQYSTGSVSNAFFDASGKVKSMAEVAEVLKTSLSGMTEAQKLSTLETLFGSDAIRAGAVLAKEGAAGFNDMATAMGKVTAKEVGAEKLNNLSGAFEQLKGSLETAAITLGIQLLPALTSLTKWATEGVNALIPMIEGIGPAFQRALDGLEPFAGAVAAFLGIELADYTSGWVALGDALSYQFGELKAGIRLLQDLLDVFLGGDSFDAAAEMLDKVFGPAVTDMILDMVAVAGDAVRGLGAFIVGQFTMVADWFQENLPLMRQTVQVILEAIAAFWNEHGGTIVRVVRNAWTIVSTIMQAALDTILSLLTIAMDLITGNWEEAWDTMVGLGERNLGRIGTIIGAAFDAYYAIVDHATGGMLTRISTWLTDASQAISDSWNGIKVLTVAIWAAMTTTVIDATAAILKPIVETWTEIERITGTIFRAVQNILTAIWDAIYESVIKPKLDAISTYVSTTWEAIRADIETKVNLARDIIGLAWDAVSKKATEVLSTVLTYVRDTIFEPIRVAVETKINAARDLFGLAVQAISDKAHEILDPILSYWRDTIWEPMRSAVDTAMYGPKGVFTQFDGGVSSINGVVDGTLQGIKRVWESTWTAIQKAAESPKDAMDVLIKLVQKLKDIMPEWLIPHSPTPFQIGLEGIAKAAKEMGGAFGGIAVPTGELVDLARRMAQEYNIDPGIFTRQITRESNFNPGAINPNSGAAGLGQFMPGTAREIAKALGMTIQQLMGSPANQLRGAAYYLDQMRDMFGGDMVRALAAYNWGPGNVRSWNGDLGSLPGETRQYLRDILGLASGGIVSASPGGMLARLGEGGRDEAVIPLPRNWRAGGVGSMQTMRLDIAVGGKLAKQIVIEGYDIAVRGGWTPAGLRG